MLKTVEKATKSEIADCYYRLLYARNQNDKVKGPLVYNDEVYRKFFFTYHPQHIVWDLFKTRIDLERLNTDEDYESKYGKCAVYDAEYREGIQEKKSNFYLTFLIFFIP